jgi:hypothetical protein
MTVEAGETRKSWGVTVRSAIRRLSAVTAAGALLGLVVGGIGSRLAMMLLARLNPEVSGMTSDDGFVMGQLTLQTLDLLSLTTLLGVVGGGIYFLLRGLMIGPRWFQVLSVSVGPAVVVGSLLVHVDGVDFTLDPVWLAIAMFVAIPGAYAALMTVVAERWLLWTPIAPILGALAVGLLLFEALRRTRSGETVLGHPAGAWLVRGALAVLFTVSLVDLVRDAATLT